MGKQSDSEPQGPETDPDMEDGAEETGGDIPITGLAPFLDPEGRCSQQEASAFLDRSMALYPQPEDNYECTSRVSYLNCVVALFVCSCHHHNYKFWRNSMQQL